MTSRFLFENGTNPSKLCVPWLTDRVSFGKENFATHQPFREILFKPDAAKCTCIEDQKALTSFDTRIDLRIWHMSSWLASTLIVVSKSALVLANGSSTSYQVLVRANGKNQREHTTSRVEANKVWLIFEDLLSYAERIETSVLGPSNI